MQSKPNAPNPTQRAHWDNVYASSPPTSLGWYENTPEPSLRLIKAAGLPRSARILDVGAGATTLVDALLEQGFENLIVNDISQTAIDKLKARLGDRSEDVSWITDDLVKSEKLGDLPEVDLWHDRAVLHFFATAPEQQEYFRLLRKLVRRNGFVIISAFHLDGATRCSGLPVEQYDEHILADKLGEDFQLRESFTYAYRMPSGNERLFVYTLFKRVA
jgi:SAM-dependent methyltransferase